MSLWVIQKQIIDGDRELTLRASGSKYTLEYTRDSQRITLQSNMVDEGYAIYMFNLFKKDLGFEKKEEVIQQPKVNYDDIRDVISDTIKENLDISIERKQHSSIRDKVTVKVLYGEETIASDDFCIPKSKQTETAKRIDNILMKR